MLEAFYRFNITGDWIFFLWIAKSKSMKIMDNLLKPLRAYHKIDTFRGEQRWMGHKGGP